MDPVLHLLLPLLMIVAVGVDKRKALLLAPFAILPDLDVLFGLHRSALHSFLFILVSPLVLIIYSRLKKPEWLLGAYLALFYLASHIVLDHSGVAFLWPFVQEGFYLDVDVTLTVRPEWGLGFDLDYGKRELTQATTTYLVSDIAFAVILLGVIMAAVFRKEAAQTLRWLWGVLKDLARNVLK